MNELGPPAQTIHDRSTARRAPVLPSWILSAVLHVLILVLAAGMLRLAPRQGASAERTAEVGIALEHLDGTFEYYDTDASAGARSQSANAHATSLENLLNDQPQVDTAAALPAKMGVIGPSVVQAGGPADPGPKSGGYAGSNDAIGGEATVKVFGVEGTGYKFVYVFDRSNSMGGSGRNALMVAKNELIASLESLKETHQFQIIFYNDQQLPFNPSGQPGKLAFATERNKQRARRFIGGVVDAGATEHEAALKLAIKYRPDVIFFLTDAAVPRLDADQLRTIRRRASGITINAIEFGRGPKQGGDNFLTRLARQNGGQYCYRDISGRN
jgi:hypothetical protein